MTGPGRRKYSTATFAILCSAIAALLGAVLALTGSIWGAQVVRWSLIGWFAMTAVGVAGGSWLLARHGSPGAGFLVALGASMLARLIVAPAGAFAASNAGVEALWGYLVGLAVGYVPPQASEVVWLMARSR